MTETVPGTTDTSAWRTLQEQLARRGERRLVLLDGDRDQSMRWLQSLLPALNPEPGLWTGPEAECPDSRLATVAARKARQWLGRELAVVVWDGWQGNPPDSLAAISGCLRAGGLLFWLMPPLVQWSRFKDPDYERTGLAQAQEHPFAARMAAILEQDPDLIRVSSGARVQLPVLPPPQREFSVATTGDQQALLQELVRFGMGRRRRPLVITADRGRGKSAALGMAAAKLLLQGRRQILVTAPSADQVQTLFHHALLELADEVAQVGPGLLETRTGACLRFLEMQELLATAPEAEVVMVDEAAAIPAPLLKRVLLGWPRVVFASTVHGYEGTGRGFAIRFRKVLDQETPQWQARSLSTPVRWAPGDPLEALVSRLFLLAAQGTDPDIPQPEDAGAVIIEPWQPGQASEAELAGAFGLLVDAHYRTRPGDLRQWLDDPMARSWRARVGERILGVLWASEEGGLAQELAQQITLGQRRIRGHLLPQSLASHSGFPEAASQRCLRVVRIAVANGSRRLGIGRRLLAAAAAYGSRAGLDSLGTSFGGTVELLAFWQSCGLQLVRLGLQQEASSGEYPVQMLQGLSTEGSALAQRLRLRLGEHWRTLVPVAWPRLEPALLLELTEALDAREQLSEDDLRDLHSFARGHRGFVLSLPVLQKASLTAGFMAGLREQADAGLWCRAVLQQQGWPELQSAGLCLGQRDGEDRLRHLAEVLLQGSSQA